MKKLKLMRFRDMAIMVVVCLNCSCGEIVKQKREQIPYQGKNEMQGIGVYLNVIVPNDDIFEVYYFESGEDGFSSKEFVFRRVKGNSKPQDIYFELPKDVYPERLRLDFGKTRDQDVISLNSIGLFHKDKEYIFSRSEIIKEFRPSKFIEFDKENMTLTTKVVDGQYDPYLYSKKVNNIVNYLLED